MRALRVFLLAVGLVLGGCDAETAPDAGDDFDAGAAACEGDADCDDGVYCNGAEQCDAGACEAGVDPCDGAMCVEAEESCETGCADADGDGRFDIACGGDDCDDADLNRYPGNPEVCDSAGHDEDCEDLTFGFRDGDGDTFPDARCCNGDNCGSDCDDAQPAVHFGLAESCDSLDNDCDGAVDEGVLRTFHPDADGDSFGAEGGTPMMGCTPPADYVENDSDCDDEDAAIQPLAREVCDATCTGDGSDCVDENCDGVALQPSQCECTVGETVACADRGIQGACGAGTMMCSTETGTFGPCSIGPATEVCNSTDDDCDGAVDEALVTRTCWTDADGDGYALESASTTTACGACPPGTTDRMPLRSIDTADCNDGAGNGAFFYPGAPERCDGRDNSCDPGPFGGTEYAEDEDEDGYPPAGAPCTGGPLAGRPIDCHDQSTIVFPGQTMYFMLGLCPQGDTNCCCENVERPGDLPLVCRPNDANRDMECLNAMDNHDFNCDGAETRMPGCSGQCGIACPCR